MGPSKQDVMLEKLARWKAEKAARKQRVEEEKPDTDLTRRQPLKRVRQCLHTGSVKQQGPAVDNRVISTKDRGDSISSVTKSPAQEMSVREKLELWKAQKQQSAKKKQISSVKSDDSVKRAAPSKSLTLITVTPSSKLRPTPLPLAGKAGKPICATPKNRLFKTPTPAKCRAPRSDDLNRSGPMIPKAISMRNENLSMDGSRCPTAESRHTSSADTHGEGGDCPPTKRRSLGRGDLSSKRRVVSFCGSVTPMRCSPRLQGKRQHSGDQGQAPQETTPKPMLWQDKQLDMKQRLEHWLASKGKTPSRYSYLLNFKRTTPADHIRRKAASRRTTALAKATPPVWHLDPDEPPSTAETGTSQDDELMAALSSTMDECFLLLKSGCPTEHVSEWLDSLAGKVPAMHQCAQYWLCRVAIARDEGQDANEIINIYEEAVREGAKPISEVKASLQQYVTDLVDPRPSPQAANEDIPTQPTPVPDLEAKTPQRVKDPAAMKQLLQSSVLKYCLTESTPYFDRIRTAIGESAVSAAIATPRLHLVTPVRRSTRLEGRRSVLPASLHDHDICLASLDELPSSGPHEFILRTNRALDEEFSSAEDENVDPSLGNQ